MYSDAQVWTNSVDPDQTPQRECGVWPGSTQFATYAAILDLLIGTKM